MPTTTIRNPGMQDSEIFSTDMDSKDFEFLSNEIDFLIDKNNIGLVFFREHGEIQTEGYVTEEEAIDFFNEACELVNDKYYSGEYNEFLYE